MEIEYSLPVRPVLERLAESGHKAYVVGACVRDWLLGRSPREWEIVSSAEPGEIAALLAGAGLGRFTISAQDGAAGLENEQYCCEIISLGGGGRAGSPRSLEAELGCRDFTVNAMAYSLRRGLLDPFGGREDLDRRRIHCVGDPDRCFAQNGYGILRMVRAAAVLGFRPDEEALRAAEHHLDMLETVPAERVGDELRRMFAGGGEGLADQIRAAQSIFMAVLPELRPMVGFRQNNRYHVYDVWQHTLAALAAADRDGGDGIVRLAVLFHDIGKPYCYTEDEKGTGHFYGHGAVSTEIADRVLRRLQFDDGAREKITELIKYHDADLRSAHRSVRKWLGRLGEEQLRRLIEVHRCDIFGQNPQMIRERIAQIQRFEAILSEIAAEEKSFQVRDLAVTGADLLQLGYLPGRELGEALRELSARVADGHIANERDILLEEAAKIRFD